MSFKFKEFYSPRDIAKICNISHATITNYCNKGAIKCEKSKVTNYIKVPHSSLLDFIRKNNLSEEVFGYQNVKKVFIIDDNDIDQKIIQSYLSLIKEVQWDVYNIKNGYEALLLCGTEQPDLILLDLMMPEIDGFEVCRHLKDNPKTKDIAITIVSSLEQPKAKSKAFSVGASGYICKPIHEHFFKEEIRKQLSVIR